MAAGDITRDGGKNPSAEGAHWKLRGTIEVDDIYRAYALMDTKSVLIDFQLIDTDGAGSYEADINVNASGTTTNGTVSIAGNHVTVETVRYVATYL